MAKLKVTWMGSTSIEGRAEHESGDLLAIGADVLQRGIVIDHVWTHPCLIKQISIIPEPAAAIQPAVEEPEPGPDPVLTDGDEPVIPSESEPTEPVPATDPATGTGVPPPSDPASSVPDTPAAGGLGGPPATSTLDPSAPAAVPATTD
jgi:hypothetical protein